MVEDHGQYLASLELSFYVLSQWLHKLESLKLMAKFTDLEGWSRRQNLHILGLPEAIEGGRPTDFFLEMLCKVIRKAILPSPEIDRAHRSLTAKPGAETTPGHYVSPLLGKGAPDI